MFKQYAKLLLFLISSTSLVRQAQAQKDFRPGYIVRLEGDTLRGEVDSRGEQRMGQQCLFRPGAGAEATRYAPTELKAYGLQGAAHYETGTLPTAPSPVFLRVVAQGKAMLYAYRDADDRVHYYFRVAAAPLAELVQTTQTVNTEGAPRQEQTYPFRQVLSRAFIDCPAVQNMLVRAEVRESQLIGIFNRYNTCAPGQAAEVTIARKSSVHFGVVLGGQSATSTLNDGGEVTLHSSLRPVVGAGLLFSPASFNSRIGIRVEALYQKQLHEGQYRRNASTVTNLTSDRNAHITLQRVLVPLMLRYTFPNGRLRPFMQAGGEFASLLDRNQALIEQHNQNLDGTYSDKTVTIEARGVGFGIVGGIGVLAPTGTTGAVQAEIRYDQLDSTGAVVSSLGGASTLSFLLSYNFGN